MPSEFRQVLFSNNELLEALYEFNQVTQTKLPLGMILSCTPVVEDKVAVRLHLMDQASSETQVAPLSSELVAAALLRYCIRHHIPIPRNAAKSVQVHGDQSIWGYWRTVRQRQESRRSRHAQHASIDLFTGRDV